MPWPMTVSIIVGALALLYGLGRSLRGKLDLLLAHASNGTRHALSIILLLGTLSGTLFTFSNGVLTLSHTLETLISVGGIALALEAGAICCGVYIQALDTRILSAKATQLRQRYERQRRELYWWFFAVVGASFVANLIFRVHQLNNFLLAAFVSLVPGLLIILFTIKLRPLPADYTERARMYSQRSLAMAAEESGAALVGLLRRIVRGQTLTEAELKQLTLVSGIVGMFNGPAEQAALQNTISAGIGGPVVDASAETWLTAADIVSQYAKSERTAQGWLKRAPGWRKGARGQLEAPASAIYRLYGPPPYPGGVLTLAAPAAPRKRPQHAAEGEQGVVMASQEAAGGAPEGAEEAQLV